MARPNFNFQKRQKELARQQKRLEKLARKRERGNAPDSAVDEGAAAPEEAGETPAADAPTDD